MTNNDGGPAFPAKRAVEQMLCTGYDEHESPTFEPTMVIADYPGMTLRDYFAGQALAGIVAADAVYNSAIDSGLDPVVLAAQSAYSLADAMIAARGVL